MPETPDWTAIDALLERALAEDLGSGDVTTRATVPPERRAVGLFVAKEEGVLAGLAVAERLFAHLDPDLQVGWTVADGATVRAGTTFGRVEGNAHPILAAERLALNVLQRMSGIATATRRMAEAARPARLLDTRKTAPGLRVLDKWAVRLGGGENHRHGLYDRILIKDNHLAAAGGVRAALEAARRYREAQAPDLLIEVEARTLEEVDEVLATGGADWILLDNMVRLHDDGFVDTTTLQEAVRRVGGRLTTEASGNVTLETVAAIAATGVDYVSCGALTHSVRALDLSLALRLV